MSATCRTCPLWEQLAGQEEDANPRGFCHHATAMLGDCGDVILRASAWCSEHPLAPGQRDRLAAMAMQAIIAGSGGSGVFWSLPNSTARAAEVASSAYAFADALLAERGGTP